MLEQFKQHINQNLTFLNKSKILIAVSGGIDSVVLTHLCHKLGLHISLAHCNFKLRYEDSDKDAAFVKNLANKLQIQEHHIEFDTTSYSEENNISTQMAARELRYEWFETLINKFKYDCILTAHHANDNIETVLINLTRGASINGLVGIPEINGNIVRPLLPFTRKAIEHFTIAENITWREDESNQSTKYVRNKIRHKVMPVLEELNPGLSETFNTHLSYLKKEHQVLTQHLEQVKKEVCIFDNQLKIDIEKLIVYDNVQVYLRHILKAYNFTEWHNIADLCKAQTGKFVQSVSHRLVKNRGYLLLEENKVHLQNTQYNILESTKKLVEPINIEFVDVKEVCSKNKNEIFVDADIVKYPLSLRKKQDGDVFFPFGMSGKKKLSKYFKDEKLSLIDKENCWLLCDATNTIIWVVGMRADKRFSVNKTTNRIVKITRS